LKCTSNKVVALIGQHDSGLHIYSLHLNLNRSKVTALQTNTINLLSGRQEVSLVRSKYASGTRTINFWIWNIPKLTNDWIQSRHFNKRKPWKLCWAAKVSAGSPRGVNIFAVSSLGVTAHGEWQGFRSMYKDISNTTGVQPNNYSLFYKTSHCELGRPELSAFSNFFDDLTTEVHTSHKLDLHDW